MPVASSTVNSLLFRRLATGEKGDQGQRERHGESAGTLCDSQFRCVLRDVIGDFGEFLVRAVHRRALTATLLRARQVSKTVPAKLTPVILGTWLQSQTERHRVSSSRKESKPHCLPEWRSNRVGGRNRVGMQQKGFEMQQMGFPAFVLVETGIVRTGQISVGETQATITSECDRMQRSR